MATMLLADRAAGVAVLGSRLTALPVREWIEQALDVGERVVIDFAGVKPTQSFIDELVGVLVLERGEAVLKSLVFKNCSVDTETILHFVVSDRLDQLGERQYAH